MAVARKVNVKNQIHYFKRFCSDTQFAYLPGTISGSLGVGYAYNFNFLPASTEFTNLFDSYKITCVVHRFTLCTDPGQQSIGASFGMPRMTYTIDQDDAATPLTLDSVREHGRARTKWLRPGQTTSIVIRPSVNTSADGYATASPKRSPWIDFAHVNIPHHGLKVFFDNHNNSNMVIKQEVLYYFACRDTR